MDREATLLARLDEIIARFDGDVKNGPERADQEAVAALERCVDDTNIDVASAHLPARLRELFIASRRYWLFGSASPGRFTRAERRLESWTARQPLPPSRDVGLADATETMVRAGQSLSDLLPIVARTSVEAVVAELDPSWRCWLRCAGELVRAQKEAFFVAAREAGRDTAGLAALAAWAEEHRARVFATIDALVEARADGRALVEALVPDIHDDSALDTMLDRMTPDARERFHGYVLSRLDMLEHWAFYDEENKSAWRAVKHWVARTPLPPPRTLSLRDIATCAPYDPGRTLADLAPHLSDCSVEDALDVLGGRDHGSKWWWRFLLLVEILNAEAGTFQETARADGRVLAAFEELDRWAWGVTSLIGNSLVVGMPIHAKYRGDYT